jgi:AcrR family transcriptional regulator
MPTSTFFNLPQEKREKLICAIKDEFSRVPFEAASINKIIQAAKIPRGSFYQYFADKNDMLSYILLEYMNQMLEHIKHYLTENNGDIFGMFYDILEFTITFVTEEKGNNFCKNLFADIKINSDFYFKIPKGSPEIQAMKELQPYINMDMLDLQDEDDFLCMLGVLISICRDAIVEVFLNLAQREKIKNRYKRRIELIKRGFARNKGEYKYNYA